jgi:hypothetical protein
MYWYRFANKMGLEKKIFLKNWNQRRIMLSSPIGFVSIFPDEVTGCSEFT